MTGPHPVRCVPIGMVCLMCWPACSLTGQAIGVGFRLILRMPVGHFGNAHRLTIGRRFGLRLWLRSASRFGCAAFQNCSNSLGNSQEFESLVLRSNATSLHWQLEFSNGTNAICSRLREFQIRLLVWIQATLRIILKRSRGRHCWEFARISLRVISPDGDMILS